MSSPASRGEIRTVGFRPGERNVFLHLLTGCNLACRHCYINPAQHGAGMLDTATALAWLELFPRPANLVLLGGEPTMHPDLGAIIRGARGLGYESITVDTNGYLFHDFLHQVEPGELDALSFSLDGPDPEVNDPLRGAGVFDTCVRGIRAAVERGFAVSSIYTVSARNIDHLHRQPELLASLGVRRFFIQVIGLRGRSAASGDTPQVDPDHWLAVVPEVARQAADLGLHTTFPKVFLDADEDFACAGVAADNAFIFPNGRVYRCPLCEDHPVHGREIREGRLRDVEGLSEDRFFTLRIPEGCVMHRLLQPDNIGYGPGGEPLHRISCCLLKQEILPSGRNSTRSPARET